MARKSCTLQSGPSNIPNSQLGPYIVITVLLTVFPVLSFTSLWLFCDYPGALLNPFTFFTQSLNFLHSGNHQSVLCIHRSLSVFKALFLQWHSEADRIIVLIFCWGNWGDVRLSNSPKVTQLVRCEIRCLEVRSFQCLLCLLISHIWFSWLYGHLA